MSLDTGLAWDGYVRRPSGRLHLPNLSMSSRDRPAYREAVSFIKSPCLLLTFPIQQIAKRNQDYAEIWVWEKQPCMGSGFSAFARSAVVSAIDHMHRYVSLPFQILIWRNSAVVCGRERPLRRLSGGMHSVREEKAGRIQHTIAWDSFSWCIVQLFFIELLTISTALLSIIPFAHFHQLLRDIALMG